MELFASLMESSNGFVWGVPMMVLLLGVGAFLTVGPVSYTHLTLPTKA